MEKKYIFLILLLLTVGFASVNTIIDIKGKVNMSLLESDLEVIFKEVLLNKENNDKAFIIDDGKSFIYSADELEELNQTSNIDYTIMNKSHQYDMEVKVSCTTDYKEYLSYTSETIDKSILIEAGEVISGNIITELIKENTSNESIALKCTLNYIPVSRDTVVEEKEYIVSFDTGYEEKVSDIKVKYYETYVSLPTLERKNYKFLGWYTSENIKVENNSLVKIKDNHILHAKWEKICEYDIGKTWTFGYTGGEQIFTTPCDGEYRIELWGASGGHHTNSISGNGAYVSGVINLKEFFGLHVYVGSSGIVGNTSGRGGGYNGGGNAQIYTSVATNKYGGGGSTDIRLVNGVWNNFSSLKSRIMVAGGGGGESNGNGYLDLPNMCAGGVNGYSGGAYSAGGGGTQTFGGVNYVSSIYGSSEKGVFGRGGNGNSHAGGGGSGYYGGGGGARDYTDGNGGGGSSFISGHNGCDAIAESSTSSNIIHTGQPNHYSGYVFTDTVMIDGAGYKWTNVKGEYTGMPSHDGKSTMTGNLGNGYAKITYIG